VFIEVYLLVQGTRQKVEGGQSTEEDGKGEGHRGSAKVKGWGLQKNGRGREPPEGRRRTKKNLAI